MTAIEIPRVKFAAADKALNDARIELARNAREKLGYKVLSRALAEPDALLYALKQLNMAPLEKQKVRAYMASKEKYGMWSGTRNGIIAIAAIITFASLFMTGMTHFPFDKPWPEWIYGVNFSIFLCGATAVIFAIWNGGSGNWGRGTRTAHTWERIPLPYYQGNVPEFVLSRALEIQQRVPGVQFDVIQLTDTTESKAPVRLIDPFLIAYLGEQSHPTEHYYIDVWDEKDYEL
jgi:hypothetical protein